MSSLGGQFLELLMQRFLPLGLLALLLASCVPVSKQPLYSPNDLIFEEGLVGDWQQPGQKDVPFLKKGDGKSYLYGEKKDAEPTIEYRLLKLGEHYFLDGTGIGGAGGHVFFKVGVVGQEARVRFLHPEWLLALVKKDPKAVTHEVNRKVITENGQEKVQEEVVLTGPTKELQAFVLAQVDSPSAWLGPVVFKAMQNTAVTEAGLFSKKQQTFEYWFEFRTALRSLASKQGDDPVSAVSDAATFVTELPGEGVDADAVALGTETSRKLERIVEQVRKGEPAGTLIQAFLKETAEPTRKTAANLAERYSLTFRGID
jgi:hypothetical protein